ncbi:uncharacterized protein LOC135845415 isoform X2 [Planococcus citri]|uniref:uncharacterized protein LOC135845415 isoform X2 n=1 Tax=Planococcus citri TaxID=170843 RepID=UPI0031F7E7FD
MMDLTNVKDIEELVICNLCKQKFNHLDFIPKLLTCKHYFCLSCIRSTMMKGMEVFCVNCWKRTELEEQDPEVLPTYNPVLVLSTSLSNIKNSINGGNNVPTVNHESIPPDKDKKMDTCHAHSMPLSLWCHTCFISICRLCASQPEQMHLTHQIMSQEEAKEKLISEVQTETVAIAKLVNEVQRLVSQQRQFLLKVHEACITLKAFIETDLQNGLIVIPEVDEARTLLNRTQIDLGRLDELNDVQLLYSNLVLEKQKLQTKCQEMYMQCRMDALIRNANVVFDFSLIRHVLDNLNSPDSSISQQLSQHQTNGAPLNNPILFLANYCMSQLYSRHVVSKQQQQQQQQQQHRQCLQQNGIGSGVEFVSVKSPSLTPSLYGGGGPASTTGAENCATTLLAFNPTIQPLPPLQQQPTAAALTMQTISPSFVIFYFNVEVNGSPFGRILIETRPDVAPKMVRNFSALASGEMGFGYKGCLVFQCWAGESIITGDFELNNGRGGRSIYEEGFFIPDDTKFPATRGAVGMRRTQKKHDSLGMVGSQFRIILQEMKGFTAIFGHVVEGLDLIEKIATFGDLAGKPTKSIVIASCGKL